MFNAVCGQCCLKDAERPHTDVNIIVESKEPPRGVEWKDLGRRIHTRGTATVTWYERKHVDATLTLEGLHKPGERAVFIGYNGGDELPPLPPSDCEVKAEDDEKQHRHCCTSDDRLTSGALQLNARPMDLGNSLSSSNTGITDQACSWRGPYGKRATWTAGEKISKLREEPHKRDTRRRVTFAQEACVIQMHDKTDSDCWAGFRRRNGSIDASLEFQEPVNFKNFKVVKIASANDSRTASYVAYSIMQQLGEILFEMCYCCFKFTPCIDRCLRYNITACAPEKEMDTLELPFSQVASTARSPSSLAKAALPCEMLGS